MTNRDDHSMLLILSQEEAQAMKAIIDSRGGRGVRMSAPRRWLCAAGAAVLVALMTLGLINPELAISIAKLAGVVLAF